VTTRLGVRKGVWQQIKSAAGGGLSIFVLMERNDKEGVLTTTQGAKKNKKKTKTSNRRVGL